MTIEEELQINVHTDLQKLISHYTANPEIDIFTATSMINLVSGEYLKSMKAAWSALCSDKDAFEAAFRKDIETLIETVEE
jgi:hypothetical protein